MTSRQSKGETAAPSSHSSEVALAQGWCALSVLHDRIHAHIERALQAKHDLSVREFSLLNVLSHQQSELGDHLHMKEVAKAVVLSQSATTRLVTRLEDRGYLCRFLCQEDKRGIYTNVTPEGLELLAAAKPTNQKALTEALELARADENLRGLVEALELSGGAG
ncbi:MarR family transcriptional regulator [bacterium]|nr:MAG: MarR family transcriptional regulator [bacterium]